MWHDPRYLNGRAPRCENIGYDRPSVNPSGCESPTPKRRRIVTVPRSWDCHVNQWQGRLLKIRAGARARTPCPSRSPSLTLPDKKYRFVPLVLRRPCRPSRPLDLAFVGLRDKSLLPEQSALARVAFRKESNGTIQATMSSGGISLVKELRHPILKSILAKDVVLFKAKYEAYEHQVEEINSNRSASQKIKPTELQFCIDPPLLKSLLRLGVFNDHVEEVDGETGTIDSVSELNHKIVKLWMEDRAEVDEADLAARVAMALSEVKFKPNRSDARGSVTTFFTDVLMKLEEHGCGNVVDTAGKELTRQVLPLIRPKSVKDVLEREWKFWTPKDKNNFMKFQRYVTSSVTEAAKWTSNKRAFEADESDDSDGPASKMRRGANGQEDQRESDKSCEAETGKGKGANKLKWEGKCLNPNCEENHRVRDCAQTSKQLADELLAKHANVKKAERAARAAGGPEERT